MGLVLSQLAWVGGKIKDRSRTCLKAEKHEDRLSVGLGGQVPVFPPLFAALASTAAGLCWSLTGKRYPFFSNSGASPLVPGCLVVPLRLAVAGAVLLSGLKTKVACDKALAASGTEADFAPVKDVAQTGPYAHSRNAMYLALTCLPLALSVAVDSGWVAGASAATLAYCHFVVVPAEEKFLEKELGKAYLDYKTRVPRWIPKWVLCFPFSTRNASKDT